MTLVMSGVSGSNLIPVPDMDIHLAKFASSEGVPLTYKGVESTNEYALVYLRFQNESSSKKLSLVVTFRRRMEYHVLTTFLQVVIYGSGFWNGSGIYI